MQIFKSISTILDSVVSIVTTTATVTNDLVQVNGRTAVNISTMGLTSSYEALDESQQESKLTVERIGELNKLTAAMLNA
jgi:hypothetical protein